MILAVLPPAEITGSLCDINSIFPPSWEAVIPTFTVGVVADIMLVIALQKNEKRSEKDFVAFAVEIMGAQLD